MTDWTDIDTTAVDLDSPLIQSLTQAIRGNLLHLRESLTFGQCRLTKSGANLSLDRFNGTRLFINGATEIIPVGGVTLAATGLAIDTTFFIYAFMSVGVMTLEASATAHATDAATGIEIKSGDATRTLVGLARTIAGPAWADTDAQRFVIGYFNRRAIACRDFFTTPRSTTATSFVELNSEIRNEFLTWGDEAIEAMVTGSVNNATTGNPSRTTIGIDDATPEQGGSTVEPVALKLFPALAWTVQILSEGNHYTTVLGVSDAGTAAQWYGHASDAWRTTLQTVIQG